MPPIQRVLCAEDDPDIRGVVRIALETIGHFTLELCADGLEAVRRAPRFRPDALLLDVEMPGLDGPATLGALRALPGMESTPAVFMTARSRAREIDRLLDLGAQGVIVKPFDPMRLGEQIRELCGRPPGAPSPAR